MLRQAASPHRQLRPSWQRARALSLEEIILRSEMISNHYDECADITGHVNEVEMISLFCLKEWRLDESGVDSAPACSHNALLIRSQSPGANEARPFGKQFRLGSSGRRRQEETDEGAGWQGATVLPREPPSAPG